MSSVLAERFKDPFPALSHYFGAVLAALGGMALVMAAWETTGLKVMAAGVYAFTAVAVFTASGLCHTAKSDLWEDRFHRLDFSTIFLFIAGTYTPVCLLALRPPWGYWILGAEWVSAVCGIVAVMRPGRYSKVVRVVVYVLMGWLGIGMAPMLIRVLHADVLGWLIAGGVVYSLGAVVYVTGRPVIWPGRFVAHDLWHVMVIMGAGCHYVAVWKIVVG